MCSSDRAGCDALERAVYAPNLVGRDVVAAQSPYEIAGGNRETCPIQRGIHVREHRSLGSERYVLLQNTDRLDAGQGRRDALERERPHVADAEHARLDEIGRAHV